MAGTTGTAVSVYHGTTAAGYNDLVTITGNQYKVVEIYNRGTSDLFYRDDGVDAVVNGTDSKVVSAGQAVYLYNPATGDNDTNYIHLTSAVPVLYTVTGQV